MNSAIKACLIVAAIGGTSATALCCYAGLALMALSSSSGAGATPTKPIDPLAALSAELDSELGKLYGPEFQSVELSNRILTVQADLGPVNSDVRVTATGTILAVIGNHRPAADWIHIETPSGQRIRVRMSDLLEYTSGRIDMSQFMGRWEVTKP